MSLWERLTARTVEASALGQKKRAAATGLLAFDGPLSDLRLEIAIKSHPWLQSTAAVALLLSTWASRALQDMAAVMEADAARHLGESGRLPEATFALADGLYDSALIWIDFAQSAQAAIESHTGFVPRFRLPAPTPRFDWVAEAPPAHFVAAIAGAVQLGTSAEEALNTMQENRSRLPRRYDGAFEAITGANRHARAKLDQVEAAASDRQAVRLSRDIWMMLQEVVRLYFLSGQQATRPGLIDSKYEAGARGRGLPPPPQSGSQGPPPVQPSTPAPAPVQRVQPPDLGAQDWSSVDWTGRHGPTTGPEGPARSPVRAGQGSAMEPSAFTWYDLLGVLPGSSPEQISCEYRSKASVLCPALLSGAPSTVNAAASREQRMLEGAFQVLGDL
ncbi:MAG: J domain-containing protein, partial [Streptosporangiaceae bacterium]